ncbi:MAG: hypothetical protein ABMB14_21460 [Myxococcota bacterium]
MSYFDHVRCSSCRASLDPETLTGPTCPRCGATLAVGDLFGIGDPFADPDEPQVTLDDLVPPSRSPGPSPAPAPDTSLARTRRR